MFTYFPGSLEDRLNTESVEVPCAVKGCERLATVIKVVEMPKNATADLPCCDDPEHQQLVQEVLDGAKEQVEAALELVEMEPTIH